MGSVGILTSPGGSAQREDMARVRPNMALRRMTEVASVSPQATQRCMHASAVEAALAHVRELEPQPWPTCAGWPGRAVRASAPGFGVSSLCAFGCPRKGV